VKAKRDGIRYLALGNEWVETSNVGVTGAPMQFKLLRSGLSIQRVPPKYTLQN